MAGMRGVHDEGLWCSILVPDSFLGTHESIVVDWGETDLECSLRFWHVFIYRELCSIGGRKCTKQPSVPSGKRKTRHWAGRSDDVAHRADLDKP